MQKTIVFAVPAGKHGKPGVAYLIIFDTRITYKECVLSIITDYTYLKYYITNLLHIYVNRVPMDDILFQYR